METERNPQQNHLIKTFVIPLFLVVIAFGAGAFLTSSAERQPVKYVTSEDSPFDLNYLYDVYSTIESEYLGDLPSKEEVTRGLAGGLVKSLNDEYTAFLTPEEADQYFDFNDSAYEGIGVQLGFDGQYTTVVTPIDGFPGQKAGMQAKDIVLEVNGEDVTGQRPEIVATKIRGQAGTEVEIIVFRETESRSITFNIKRASINLENITYEDKGNGIVVIDIVKFTEGANGSMNGVEVFNRTWDRIAGEVDALNPKAIVIDLRNNPGGFVDSVKHVASEFLKEGEIIMRERTSGEADEKIFYDQGPGLFEDLPVVVLVNEGSASAAEILSAAIQENDHGKVIGKPTVGKGVEQRLEELPDGSLIMLVFRRWLTADGNQLSADNPIKPDEELEATVEDVQAGKDVVMERAIELLSK